MIDIRTEHGDKHSTEHVIIIFQLLNCKNYESAQPDLTVACAVSVTKATYSQ